MVDTKGAILSIANYIYNNYISTELDFPLVLGIGNSSILLSDPGMDLLIGLSTFKDYTEEQNRILTSGQLTDRGVIYIEDDQEMVVNSGQSSQDYAGLQSLEARITRLKTKIEELQKWQAL